MVKLGFQRSVVAGLVLCLSLSGCVTTGGPGNGMNGGGMAGSAGGGDGECHEGIAAGVGALVGGLLANGNNRVRGAALGAGVAALGCVAWNFNVRQTKTAQQVQADYLKSSKGRMPEVAKVVRYDSQFSPSGRVVPGGQVVVNSSIDVVGGARDASLPVVEEEMTMVRPDGKQVTSRKVVNEGQGAGGYQSSFVLKMPKGVPEGEYPVKTAVYLNGQPAGSRNLMMQVVRLEGAGVVVALR